MPDTYVYLGKEVPKTFFKEIKSLDLLEPGERIQYFYSDAFMDIKEGMFMVTDRHFIAYSTQWEDPKTIIDFEDIVEITANFNEAFLEDSFIKVTTLDGFWVEFPVSSEKGRDKAFHRYLEDQSPNLKDKEKEE